MQSHPHLKRVSPPPTLFPHTSLAINLLSDLSPDPPLSWIIHENLRPAAKQRPIPPQLSRVLISILLRAASVLEADATYEALLAVIKLPEPSPCACLGFSAQGVAQENLSAVLCELVTKAARQEPLLVSGDVLMFYCEAGHGSADADEYHDATPDRRDLMVQAEELRDVRLENMARVLDLVARAIDRGDATTERIVNALKGTSRFLTPLVAVLPQKAHLLHGALLGGLKRVYEAYLGALGGAGREDVVTKLVTTVMGLANGSVENLGTYLDVIADADIKFRVCRICMMQRFKVKDQSAKPFSLSVLERFLNVQRKEVRPNKAVPALLAALIMSWFKIASEGDFHVPDTVAYLQRIRPLCDRIARKFGASKRDISCFRVATLALTHRISSSSGTEGII
eukprot:GFKZ01014552.1.p2 GENE.GFKZ01014552.1~~GFKZ01014552.1.p2  ORF type:complete len:397 (+),score=56.30 GFKZ01014552.1:175-1365(+)